VPDGVVTVFVPVRVATILGRAMAAFSVFFGAFFLINRLAPKFTVVGYWVGANPGLATILLLLSFNGKHDVSLLGNHRRIFDCHVSGIEATTHRRERHLLGYELDELAVEEGQSADYLGKRLRRATERALRRLLYKTSSNL